MSKSQKSVWYKQKCVFIANEIIEISLSFCVTQTGLLLECGRNTSSNLNIFFSIKNKEKIERTKEDQEDARSQCLNNRLNGSLLNQERYPTINTMNIW